jgi:hypothetical protein
MTALAELGVPLGVEDEEFDCNGLPFDNDRKRRVRKMYSLLHVASAVNRQKARLSDRNVSGFISVKVVVDALIDVGPGKKRAKAALQAWGVVTKAWKRCETSDTEERSDGVRWERACVRISGDVSNNRSLYEVCLAV